MRLPPASQKARRIVRTLFIMGLAAVVLPACFALFGLDGYGPPDTVDASATTDAGSADADASADAFASGTRRTVFVTSTTFAGDLGGAAGGDTKCRAAATDAGLRGNFRAWLSDGPTGGHVRVSAGSGALELTNGVVVAANAAELSITGPRKAIAVDERGRPAIGAGGGCDDGGLAVWTGTIEDGGALSPPVDCTRWTTRTSPPRGVSAIAGIAGRTGSGWTAACVRACDAPAALYCIEQ